MGSFAPKLVLDWPGMKLWHTILHKEIPIPKHSSISRYVASQIRPFFSTTFPFLKHALIYSYADKTSFPQFIRVIPGVDDINHTLAGLLRYILFAVTTIVGYIIIVIWYISTTGVWLYAIVASFCSRKCIHC